MEDLILFRGIERLLAMTIAGISIFLGYRLFAKNINISQSAEFQSLQFRIKLLRVGPGVFFALFGSIILAIQIANPVHFEVVPEANQSKAKVEVGNWSYLGGDDGSLQFARAVNGVLDVYSANEQPLSPSLVDTLKPSLEVLREARNLTIAQKFGAAAPSTWRRLEAVFLTTPDEMSANDRQTMKSLAPWMQETLAHKER